MAWISSRFGARESVSDTSSQLRSEARRRLVRRLKRLANEDQVPRPGRELLQPACGRYPRNAVADDRSYVEENTRERERMRAIVDRASDDELRISVNPHWTVAAVLGHIAFWDARVLSLADKLERGEPFTTSDT